MISLPRSISVPFQVTWTRFRYTGDVYRIIGRSYSRLFLLQLARITVQDLRLVERLVYAW